ncbi:MAG: RNA polymerase sigma factor [Solirubrobacteraceae bacterium]
MATLESLPPDQRAVLQLVLQRGRSYDDIAGMLSIDRAAVRERALAALDALGPPTRVSAPQRALITDYLLGQLPPRVGEQVRDRLGESPNERAWARVLAAELSPLAAAGLPEIPVESSRRPAGPPAAVGAGEPSGAREPSGTGEPARTRESARAREPRGTRGAAEAVGAGRERSGPPGLNLSRGSDDSPQRSSRLGGAILIGLGIVIAVVVLVIVLASGGSSTPKPATTSPAALSRTTASTPTGTTTTGPQVIGQVNLVSPSGAKGVAGVAQILRQGSRIGIVIVAQGVPANTAHDAYAVWLYSSPTTSRLLGFVSPSVKANGKLQTAGVLPTTVSQYKQLLVTLETQPKPHAPGRIVLEGSISVP